MWIGLLEVGGDGACGSEMGLVDGSGERGGWLLHVFRDHQMSRTSEHGTGKRKETDTTAKVVAKGGEPQQLLMRAPPTAGASSVSTATFSSMSKQAESLVSGGNSVVFNPYNNNLVFQWIAMNMNDCISIDTMKRAIANIANIQFTSGGTMTGISDGFIVDDRGQIVQLYVQRSR